MSKQQLLYEKLMKYMFLLSAGFFLIFLVDLFIGIFTGNVDCQAQNATLCIREEADFYKFSLIPFGIFTVIFLILGRVFYEFAHKESNLLSVSEYRRSLERGTLNDGSMSRDQLYEKLSLSRGSKTATQVPLKVRVKRNFNDFVSVITDFIDDLREKFGAAAEKQKAKAQERKEEKIKMQELAEEQKEQEIVQEHVKRSASKLNKTELIIMVSQKTGLTQIQAREFVNAFLNTIIDTVVDEEDVKIANFGRFSKVHIEEHIEIDPDTEEETKVEAHNTVEFVPFKLLLEFLNGEPMPEEEIEEDEIIEEEPEIVEEVVEEEPEIVEEVVEEEPEVVEEVVEQEPEVVEEVVEEEPEVVEEVVEEEPEVVEEVVEEEPEVVEEVVEEEPEVVEEVVKEEPKVEKEEPESSEDDSEEDSDDDDDDEDDEKPKAKVAKKAKPKIVTRTKTDIIELLDNTTDLSKNKANKFLKYFAEVVREGLANGEEVELSGIGFFTTIEMPAKEAVNPQTNEPIIVPAHNQVRLRFDDDFKDKVNES